MHIGRATGVILVAVFPAAAQFCNPEQFEGAYGFHLSGTTTISGNKKPVASMGRLEFDGEGAVNGSASVNFAGFLLGNPVSGTYELRPDCTLSWALQDDSGAYQHFAGKLSADLERGEFQQTDPGGAQRGTLAKVAPQCSLAGLQGTYDFTISGSDVPMQPGETARKISLEGVLAVDAAGNLTRLDRGTTTPAGTASVDSDCMVNITLTLVEGAGLKLRGVLVAGGKEILAIETDPGATVNARFRVRPTAPHPRDR